jgi:dTDP-L-rhamnose 4-epimerase
MALQSMNVGGKTINIGSGASMSLLDIALHLSRALGREEVMPEVTGLYRAGDIRHCFADIARAKRDLSFAPSITLDDGLQEMVAWLDGKVTADRVPVAHAELVSRGLSI